MKPGEIIYPLPDILFVHDGYTHALANELAELGVEELFDPDKVYLVTDHDVLYTSAQAASRGSAAREFARRYRVKNFYDIGRGGQGHVFPVERGIVRPGMFIFAYDMHCSNFGAVGALALRNGTEVVSVAATGTVWTQVPATVKLILTGRLAAGVYVRDLSARLASDLANGHFGVEADYRAIEIVGPALDEFSVDARMTLCNSATEIGVATVFIPPSDLMATSLAGDSSENIAVVRSDLDANFEASIEVDISSITPQVACPPSPDNLVDVTQVLGTPIQHAAIGSCASGMYEDMKTAAAILAGKRIANSVRLFITPATEDTFQRCLQDGFLQIFQEAGAIITPPGCGPCAGGKIGAVASGEASISTVTQNHPGRMGARDADLFLGSPATVAASALVGSIADARDFLLVDDKGTSV